MVNELDIPKTEEMIAVHFVFKVKKGEDGKRRLKSHLSTHGNRHKNAVRSQDGLIHPSILYNTIDSERW